MPLSIQKLKIKDNGEARTVEAVCIKEVENPSGPEEELLRRDEIICFISSGYVGAMKMDSGILFRRKCDGCLLPES